MTYYLLYRVIGSSSNYDSSRLIRFENAKYDNYAKTFSMKSIHIKTNLIFYSEAIKKHTSQLDTTERKWLVRVHIRDNIMHFCQIKTIHDYLLCVQINACLK